MSGLHQRQEPLGVALVKELSGILIPLPEPPHERMIGRLLLGIGHGFMIWILG